MGSFLSILYPHSTTVTVGYALLCILLVKSSFSKSRDSLPPGPKALPFIGHLHIMPSKRPWIWFDELCRKYNSPLVYLNFAGQDVIVINDHQVAIDILDKRSAFYSSRPRLVVAGDYASTNKRIVFLPYGDRWRQHRSAFHRDMTPAKVLTYIPIQIAETKLLMSKLLRTPERFLEHLKDHSANVILKVTYGLNSEDGNEEAIEQVYNVMNRLLASANPGAHLVDLFPSLDHLPDFLAPWRKDALYQRKITHEYHKILLDAVLDKTASGILSPESTFAARLWNDRDKFNMDELDVAYLSGTLFEAGTDTTAAALGTFVLASATNPDVYKRAQEEIDRVCGDRSPGIEDYEACEYIRAMCKETMRWRTVTAAGIPHLSTAMEDDWYMGYRIPAGATIVSNHWGMCFSEKTYGQKYDPQLFEPRRWIERPEGVGALDEGHPTFGFSRRICPGKLMAVNSLFIVISNMCYNFDIKKKSGAEIDIWNYTTGFNIEPEHFECLITPRPDRVDDIEREAAEALEMLKLI